MQISSKQMRTHKTLTNICATTEAMGRVVGNQWETRGKEQRQGKHYNIIIIAEQRMSSTLSFKVGFYR